VICSQLINHLPQEKASDLFNLPFCYIINELSKMIQLTPFVSVERYKVVLIRLGIYLFVKKQGGWEPKISYSYCVMSQLYETEIP